MSTEAERTEYRNRMSNGDTVYVVDGESVMGTGKLTVKKATVEETDTRHGGRLSYPWIRPWRDPKVDPGTIGGIVSKSPRELFTVAEALDAIESNPDAIELQGMALDEILTDPFKREELVAVLGAETMFRMMDDSVLNPRDPEHPLL